jgi:hypothetical protein
VLVVLPPGEWRSGELGCCETVDDLFGGFVVDSEVGPDGIPGARLLGGNPAVVIDGFDGDDLVAADPDGAHVGLEVEEVECWVHSDWR